MLLAFALREVPVGTGYAVWVGIGAAGSSPPASSRAKPRPRPGWPVSWRSSPGWWG
ncbi:SMR family transporter [Streptomyces anulatus]